MNVITGKRYQCTFKKDFGFSIHVAHFKSAEIAIWCYLFIYKTGETFAFLHM